MSVDNSLPAIGGFQFNDVPIPVITGFRYKYHKCQPYGVQFPVAGTPGKRLFDAPDSFASRLHAVSQAGVISANNLATDGYLIDGVSQVYTDLAGGLVQSDLSIVIHPLAAVSNIFGIYLDVNDYRGMRHDQANDPFAATNLFDDAGGGKHTTVVKIFDGSTQWDAGTSKYYWRFTQSGSYVSISPGYTYPFGVRFNDGIAPSFTTVQVVEIPYYHILVSDIKAIGLAVLSDVDLSMLVKPPTVYNPQTTALEVLELL